MLFQIILNIKEIEITHLLKEEDLDVLFLTEVDSRSLQDEKDYNIQGYKNH